MRGVPDLIKRGISVLVMDGPGTGRSDPLSRPLPAPRLRSGRQRVPRLAGKARRRRCEKSRRRRRSASAAITRRAARRWIRAIAACIAWGAKWDYYATWKKRIDAKFKTSLSVPGHHITWILGVDTLEQALKEARAFPARRRSAEDALPVPAGARRRRRADPARRRARALSTHAAPRTRRCACTPPKKAARSIASAIT